MAQLPPDPRPVLYYEAHVTIDPVFDDVLSEVAMVAEHYGFRVADLLMQKRKEDSPERSKYDTFMTSRSCSYDEIDERVQKLCSAMRRYGHFVRRAKIEATLYDVRFTDRPGN